MISGADPGEREPALPGTRPPSGAPRPGLSPRARIALPICMALLVALSVHRLACAPANTAFTEFSGPTMGTRYSVKIAGAPLDAEERSRVADAIQTELERVDSRMSTWREDSELSRFNRSTTTEAFPISPETYEVFEIAQQVSRLSDGAFDVTVGPLVGAWGFGATDRPPRPPSEEERVELAKRVGYQRLELSKDGASLLKRHPETQCDLSAIAKGYGVDRVAFALDALARDHYLVEVGGELRAKGHKRDGSAWRVGIERPDSLERRSHQALPLIDMSLATSGDYRNYYEVDGVRVSHTIDPRAGRPIRHNLASVSVLHREAAWADALATTLNVLGAEQGLAFAIRHELAALFLVREKDATFRSIASPAFEAYLRTVEPPTAGR